MRKSDVHLDNNVFLTRIKVGVAGTDLFANKFCDAKEISPGSIRYGLRDDLLRLRKKYVLAVKVGQK